MTTLNKYGHKEVSVYVSILLFLFCVVKLPYKSPKSVCPLVLSTYFSKDVLAFIYFNHSFLLKISFTSNPLKYSYFCLVILSIYFFFQFEKACIICIPILFILFIIIYSSVLHRLNIHQRNYHINDKKQ